MLAANPEDDSTAATHGNQNPWSHDESPETGTDGHSMSSPCPQLRNTLTMFVALHRSGYPLSSSFKNASGTLPFGKHWSRELGAALLPMSKLLKHMCFF